MTSYPVQDGEQVLWSGRPHRPQRWFFEHFAMVLFGVAFVVAHFMMLSQETPQWGAWILSGVFAGLAGTGIKRVRGRRALSLAIVYLVTDRRIVFVAEWPSGAEFRWVWLGQLAAPHVRADEQGIGTIVFSEGAWARFKGARGSMREVWAPFTPRLRAVPDASRVAELIRQVQGRPRTTPIGLS
jgi:hypothetical protein